LKGKDVAQAANKVCAVYGDTIVSEQRICKRFLKFRRDVFYVENWSHSGRTSTVHDDQIEVKQ